MIGSSVLYQIGGSPERADDDARMDALLDERLAVLQELA
jgi:hypothetical protein